MSAYDVMPDMELFQPVTVEDAAALAERLGGSGWVLAGGQDTYGWLKDRAKSVDMSDGSIQGVRKPNEHYN